MFIVHPSNQGLQVPLSVQPNPDVFQHTLAISNVPASHQAYFRHTDGTWTKIETCFVRTPKTWNIKHEPRNSHQFEPSHIYAALLMANQTLDDRQVVAMMRGEVEEHDSIKPGDSMKLQGAQ